MLELSNMDYNFDKKTNYEEFSQSNRTFYGSVYVADCDWIQQFNLYQIFKTKRVSAFIIN